MAGSGMDAASGNSFARYVAVKEEHAVCKRELNILSNDYQARAP